MRILQIRFKNLNSLEGEWQINLDHPAYGEDGIFAITGPTGSGKTTILDALCLALYGQTPRLNKVTKSSNEIMSRQTGECFAEVTFETPKGRFRCHWSQHRARKKPEGELQTAKHEIAEADSGKVLENKITGVAEEIEKVTGMDFARFTRSMLLAQGGFAAFLQAAPDERSPILEQITGTEIYSQISIQVHALRSAELQKLELLQAELSGIQLLTQDEESQLQSDIENKTKQEIELTQQINEARLAIAWLDRIVGLEDELKAVEINKQKLQERLEAFEPEQKKLQRSIQALEAAGEYSELGALRREQENETRNINTCREKLPQLEKDLKLATEEKEKSVQELEKVKREQKETWPRIKNVREDDLKILEKTAPIKTAEATIAEAKKNIENLKRKTATAEKQLNEKKSRLDEVKQLLSSTKADEGLTAGFSEIRNRLDALSGLYKNNRDKSNELSAMERKTAKAAPRLTALVKDLEAKKKELAEVCEKLSKKQTEREELLSGRSATDWRNDLAGINAEKFQLEKLGTATASRNMFQEKRNHQQESCDKLKNDQEQIASQLKTALDGLNAREREMSLLETQLTLLKTIQDMGEARKQLEDGKQCPLCGALEHPFAAGNIPAPDETTIKLKDIKAQVKKAANAVADFRVQEGKIQKELEQLTIQNVECSDQIVSTEKQINELLTILKIDPVNLQDEKLSERLLAANDERLMTIAQKVANIEVSEQEIAALRDAVDKCKSAVSTSEKEMQAIEIQQNNDLQAMARTRNEADILTGHIETAGKELLQLVVPYGINEILPGNFIQIQADLELRRSQWLKRQKTLSELEPQIAVEETTIRHQNETIKGVETELHKHQAALADLLRERDEIIKHRQELFGEKNPDDEEARLITALETAEQKLEGSARKFTDVKQKLEQLKQQIKEIEQSMADRIVHLNRALSTFTERIKGFGFADEAEYMSACLPEDERKILLQRSQQLSTEQTELLTRATDRTAQLTSEREKEITS
ncbi:MAG: AAA family ATPase, partial [Victivallaceae bacterium]